MKQALLSRLARTRAGATAVEFALVAPALFLLTFGIIEFARCFWTQEALEQTAMSAARCMGILNSNCASGGAYSSSNTQTYIANVAKGWGLTITTAEMTLNNAATCSGTSGFSQVTLTVTYDSAVPVLLPMLNGDTLTATACFPNNPPIS